VTIPLFRKKSSELKKIQARVRAVRNLFLDLEVSAIAPNNGAIKDVIIMETPPAIPHIRSPKFWGYTPGVTITLVKYTGKIIVIMMTANEVLARS